MRRHNYRIIQGCFIAITILLWMVAFMFCDMLITTALYRQYRDEMLSEKTLNYALQKRMIDDYGIPLVRLEDKKGG